MEEKWHSSTSWPNDSSEESTRAAQELLARDLAPKEVFDAPILKHYLRAEALPEAWVTQCRAHLFTLPAVRDAVCALRALQKDPPLEFIDMWGNTQKQEFEMYPHLLCILNAIATYSGSSRIFRCSHRLAGRFEDGFPVFSPIQPDLIMEDITPTSTTKDLEAKDSQALLWRNVLCCLTVKFNANASPFREPEHPSDITPPVKEIVSQAADYARLHMSCHPFQLFSIGVLIFASSFTVSVYDRGGVLHSCQMQVYDSHGLTDDFIRVVRLLSFDADEIDLGRDPTVTAVGATKSEKYPRYNVKACSPLPHTLSPQWTTIGRPIWTSHSLLGRGTSVWRAQSHNAPQDEQIMKTAWRHEDHDGEAEVYSYLDECKITGSPGIAAFRGGQDVSFVPAGCLREVVLSVNSLRPREARLPQDIILHRVMLTSVGKPLWEYDTPAQFIRALLAIVQGIRTLEQHDILHRDISAGNVLLAANPRPGYEAFLTDFELAKIPPRPKPIAIPAHVIHMPNERQVPNQAVKEHISWKDEISYVPGPEMTGTLQFMAIDMLDNCTAYTHGVGYPPTYEPIKRAVRHELESLVWVAEYALFRKAHQAVAHLSSSHVDRKEIETAFAEEFGCNVPSRLVKQRRQTAILPGAPNGPQQKITPYLDEPLRKLIPALMGIVKSQNDHQDLESGQFWSAERVEYEQRAPMPITCDSLEGVLRKYASVMKLF